MDITKLIEQGANINISLSLKELIQLVDYIIKSQKTIINPKDEPDFIDLAKVVQLTNYAESTIYNYISKREFPYYKKNGKLYFKRQEIIDYLNSGKRDSLNEVHKNFIKKR